MWLDEHLSIRLERHSPVATSIVLEVPFPAESGLELHGQIVGPHSAHARTLPTTLRFRPEPGSPVGLRVATRFPDFCGWSAEHPHRYRVTAELRRGRDIVERWERQWGVALLSLRGPHFYWEGRRWVMRAVEPSPDQSPDWEALRACDATCIRREPTEQECERADELGVRLVARLPISDTPDTGTPDTGTPDTGTPDTGTPDTGTLNTGRLAQRLTAQLRRLDQHPSVILAWLDGRVNWDALPKELEVPGALPIAMSIPHEVRGPVPSWLRVGIVEARQLDRLSSSTESQCLVSNGPVSNGPALQAPEFEGLAGGVAGLWGRDVREALSNRPLLVRQSWPEKASLAGASFEEAGEVPAMRRGCDRLQADVAGRGEFAGYLRERDR